MVHDRIERGDDREFDGETDDRFRWWTQLKFYGNDRRYSFNGDVCQIIRKVAEMNEDIKSYSQTPDSYELEKKSVVDYYSLPVTKKKFLI